MKHLTTFLAIVWMIPLILFKVQLSHDMLILFLTSIEGEN